MVDGNDGILLHTWRVTMFLASFSQTSSEGQCRVRRHKREFLEFKTNTGMPLGNFRRDRDMFAYRWTDKRASRRHRRLERSVEENSCRFDALHRVSTRGTFAIQPQPSCIEISSASNVHAFTRWKVRTSASYDWPRNSTKFIAPLTFAFNVVHVVNCLERTRSILDFGANIPFRPVTDLQTSPTSSSRLIQKR